MKRIELGPINLSVFGTQVYKLSRDTEFFFSTFEMVDCLVSKISEADEMLIISLKDLATANASRLVQAAEACPSLPSQIERAVSRILSETASLEAEGSFVLQKGNERRVQFLLLVLRELLNVNSAAKEIEESTKIFHAFFKSLRVFSESEDITFIVARILSKSEFFCIIDIIKSLSYELAKCVLVDSQYGAKMDSTYSPSDRKVYTLFDGDCPLFVCSRKRSSKLNSQSQVSSDSPPGAEFISQAGDGR
jgi:hypothetical protein